MSDDTLTERGAIPMIDHEPKLTFKRLKTAPRELPSTTDPTIYFRVTSSDKRSGTIGISEIHTGRQRANWSNGRSGGAFVYSGSKDEALTIALDKLFGKSNWYVEGGLPL